MQWPLPGIFVIAPKNMFQNHLHLFCNRFTLWIDATLYLYTVDRSRQVYVCLTMHTCLYIWYLHLCGMPRWWWVAVCLLDTTPILFRLRFHKWGSWWQIGFLFWWRVHSFESLICVKFGSKMLCYRTLHWRIDFPWVWYNLHCLTTVFSSFLVESFEQ